MVFPLFQDSIVTAFQYPVGCFLTACLNSGKDFLRNGFKKYKYPWDCSHQLFNNFGKTRLSVDPLPTGIGIAL
jgi:hypothetical protein